MKSKNKVFCQQKPDRCTKAVELHAFASAARSISILTNRNDIDLDDLITTMGDQISDIDRRKVANLEMMLWAQAQTLQAMMERAIWHFSNSKWNEQIKTWGHLALKAQNQCRVTLATINEISNPKRAVFVRQQNNAINQQINNDQQKCSVKYKNPSNELLSEVKHESLDIGATQTASRIDSSMAALGLQYGAKNSRRKSEE